MHPSKAELIQTLQLLRHPHEGGYFKRTYESDLTVSNATEKRKLLSTIYYMLTDDSPHGFMHRNKSDIVHFHQLGAAIRYWVISADGEMSEYYLGPDISKGHQLQMIVKGGDWKISQLCEGEYALIGEAVTPGFEYSDNEIATRAQVSSLFPHLLARIEKYIQQS